MDRFMPQLNRQLLGEFLAKSKSEWAQGAAEAEAGDKIGQSVRRRAEQLVGERREGEPSLGDMAKIPDTLFFENPLHTNILNNMLRDFELGEHLLLIGNQGGPLD